MEDLKTDFNRKVASLSTQLHTLYAEGNASNPSLSRPRGPFNRKLFLPRESVLSTMLHHDDENYKTIFNIALSVLFLWGISLAIEDYETLGAFNYDLLIWGIFRDLAPFFYHWSMMFGGSFLVLLMAHFTAVSQGFPAFHALVALYVTFQLCLFTFSWYVVFLRATPFAMPISMAFMAEQARMSMKVHAYFREKVAWARFDGQFASEPKCLSGPAYATFFGLPFPQLDYLVDEMGKFAYFMFAPTLVYRDSYPRTSRIRWGFVLTRLAEFFGIVYYAFLIFRQVLPQFGVAIDEPISARRFLRLTFRCMAPAMASMVFTHFLLLHVVQNIGAELTRFADREFYGDWWNCRTFSVFYRKVGARPRPAMSPARPPCPPVFIHRLTRRHPFCPHPCPCRRSGTAWYTTSSTTTCTPTWSSSSACPSCRRCSRRSSSRQSSTSTAFASGTQQHPDSIAIWRSVHALTTPSSCFPPQLRMGFFLPILGIMFTGPGLIFILLTRNQTSRFWNMFIWTMLSIGNAWMMVLYNREYFYRIAGPKTTVAVHGVEDFFIPRTFRLQFPHLFTPPT
jgi:sterol O-acyltransferase